MGRELIAEDRLPALLKEHQKVADQALVERARRGDQEAFSELVRAHRAQALRMGEQDHAGFASS
ncbi:hypothetical protein [Paenibacillus terrigena]|uniref:hypothetical protein n=1 Tax=Paenibacillus terrigena TaxID=369333 RepID=UPI0028D58436|nr:hypothetical protein [Paenibacillus terrigena]